MKTNFLVSAHPKARIPGARRLLVADPYVRHALEVAGETGAYEEIAVAPASRTTREAFLRDHEFVDRKHHKYLSLLVGRLNELHGMRHEPRFWQKALSLSMLRHVTLCHDLFQACEANLRPEEHDCRILAERSFFVPDDFNAHRRFFQHTDLGPEQLFGTYCRMFHPGRFAEYEDAHRWPTHFGAEVPPRPRIRHRLAQLHPRRIVRRLLRLRKPTLAVINAYFSEQNLDRLIFRSAGRIRYVRLPAAPAGGGPIDWRQREALCRDEPGFDEFDRFVFAALRHGMPRAFVEDFERLCAGYERFLERLDGLRWIVCEAWIGDAASALLLALASRRGVRHLYNEHNYLGHPFLGNNLKYLLPLVDEFATLGWDDGRAPNLVPAASLFPWVVKRKPSAGRDILYIASLPLARAPEVNASYGESGPVNAPSYLAFIRTFLDALSDATLGEIVLRKYPARHTQVMQAYDWSHVLHDRIARMKRVDDRTPSARDLMRDARLVIADYVSTAYLEALMSDIPTVFFWNRDAYHLEPAHQHFFDALRSAGICQTDPVEAARFVESIKSQPQAWWRSPAVQGARSRFLDANMGPPETMIRHLVQKCAA
ncbi:MAG TPA: LIC12162 family protein [Burkholderiales bacterium]|nr:LIC12162 family protein [Burkholderiales bacterium]